MAGHFLESTELRVDLATKQRIAVLGFAFKADTGDTRESAAITLIRDFQQEKALINIYDPQVSHEQIWQDLAEASPATPLEASECPPHSHGLSGEAKI